MKKKDGQQMLGTELARKTRREKQKEDKDLQREVLPSESLLSEEQRLHRGRRRRRRRKTLDNYDGERYQADAEKRVELMLSKDEEDQRKNKRAAYRWLPVERAEKEELREETSWVSKQV